ncbi:MAG TPA: CZB domain-containing protein [Terriglobales bacterium]|nr:CZB domain-containing protein [Terriglobales bacterium]
MSIINSLQKAISAHASWKIRLRTAISGEKLDVTSDAVKADDQCEFGKWLYGSELSHAEKQDDHYRTVKQLHAQFHQEASKVVGWISGGQKELAEKAMSPGGGFSKASTALTEAMVKWRESSH